MSNSTKSNEPRIVNYGPFRLVGVGRICKSPSDCHDVWADDKGFMARRKEIQVLDGEIAYYGICRCAVGVEPGAFEYIAAEPAANDAPVPEGMVEVLIPAGTYAEFPVMSLDAIGQAWSQAAEWSTANPEWKGFCDGNPEGCGCIANPSFELYPATFEKDGKLFIYMPIQLAK